MCRNPACKPPCPSPVPLQLLQVVLKAQLLCTLVPEFGVKWRGIALLLCRVNVMGTQWASALRTQRTSLGRMVGSFRVNAGVIGSWMCVL